jgi:ankyrin repeat protein
MSQDPSRLLAAIADGRTDLVFDYVDSGGKATDTGLDNVPLIQHCAYYGDVSAIRFLLTRGESLDNLGPNLELNGASFHGHWRLVQFVLENGADVNYTLPETGETALHAALCTSSNRTARNRVLRVLIAGGADPTIAAKPGVPTDAFMRDVRTRGETPLHRAAAFGDEEAIELLLAAGASKEARDMYGDSPLSWASWYTRPANILRKLCFGPHRIHPAHGEGLEGHLEGDPRV